MIVAGALAGPVLPARVPTSPDEQARGTGPDPISSGLIDTQPSVVSQTAA